MERKYCGKNRDEMDKVLSLICEIEDRIELSDDEQDAFDIAIQCVTSVMNCMIDGKPIDWD